MRDWLHTALLALAVGLLAWLALDLHRFIGKATVTVENYDRLAIITGAAMTSVQKGAKTWEESSKSQVLITSKAMSNVSAAASALTSFISKTDESVNSTLLPTLSRAIDSQNASLLETQSEVQKNLILAQPAILDLAVASHSAANVLSDPDIKVALDNGAKSTQNLAVATDNFAATTAKVRQGVDYEVNELMKPVKKVKAIFLFLVTVAGHFFGYA